VTDFTDALTGIVETTRDRMVALVDGLDAATSLAAAVIDFETRKGRLPEDLDDLTAGTGEVERAHLTALLDRIGRNQP
jgi:acyl-CoA hydrolase